MDVNEQISESRGMKPPSLISRPCGMVQINKIQFKNKISLKIWKERWEIRHPHILIF